MGVLIACNDESVVMLPNKSFQGTPKNPCLFSTTELER